MHINARADECITRVSSINPESFCTPVLRTQFTTTSPFPSSAHHHHFLHSPLQYTPAPSFPGFFLRERNHRFPTLVFALESLSGKCPSLFLVRRSSQLDCLCLSGTYEARGERNCMRHTSPTGRIDTRCTRSREAL